LRYLYTAPIRVSLTTESANPTSADLSRRITCTEPVAKDRSIEETLRPVCTQK
jgi:hypothetical protein